MVLQTDFYLMVSYYDAKRKTKQNKKIGEDFVM